MEQIALEDDKSIWTKDNPYTYRINIGHPRIAPLYERFKRWKSIPVWCPLSDKERFEFERYITSNALKRQETMRALTIHQPYASAIVLGIKQYETRPQKTNVRGRIAIHAGKRELSEVLRQLPDGQREELLALYRQPPLCDEMIYRGAIIGTVDLTDCVPVDKLDFIPAFERILGDYTPGRFAWVLRDPIRFDCPVPSQGQQGWWRWVR